jgi:hypothetical protein
MGTFYLDRFYLKNGGRRDYWYANHEVLHEFVTKNKLKPMDSVFTTTGAPGVSAPAHEAQARPGNVAMLWPGPIPGGIPIAHLHYAGQFYALTHAQWTAFTRQVVTEASERLSKAQKIGFEQQVLTRQRRRPA